MAGTTNDNAQILDIRLSAVRDGITGPLLLPPTNTLQAIYNAIGGLGGGILPILATIDGHIVAGNATLTSMDGRIATANITLTSIDGHLVTGNATLTAIDGHIVSGNATLTSIDGRLTTANLTLVSIDGKLTTTNSTLASILARMDTTGVKILPFNPTLWNPSFVMTYDVNGRLSTVAMTYGGTTWTKTLTYDANGHLQTASVWV